MLSGNGLPAPDVSEAAMRLGQQWRFYKRGYKGVALEQEAAEVCQQLLEDGVSEVDLEAEITRKGRDRTEPTWAFVKRMRGVPKQGQKTDADLLGSIQRFADRGKGPQGGAG